MARTTDLGGAQLGVVRQVARKLGRDVSREWRNEVKAQTAPMVADAKARFRGLGGALARRTSRSVRLRQTNAGVTIQMGGFPGARGKEFGAKGSKTFTYSTSNLFGRGIEFSGPRTIDYSSANIFGAFSGSGTGAGKAFYPAVRAHLRETRKNLQALVDRYVEVLARAFDSKGG